MPSQEQNQNAFLEWIDTTRLHKATSRDRTFIDAGGTEFPTLYLMGLLSGSMDALPAEHAWIVTDHPEYVGRQAAQTYQNAVRVVRAQRRE